MAVIARRATIKDVAAACGVSTQTVSRVINRSPKVAESTRIRVEAAIGELNYTPSALARGLQSSRSGTIGVLLAGMGYTGPALTLVGITEECTEQGLTVLIADLPNFEEFDPLPAIQSLMEHRVDGIVMSVPEVGNAVEVISPLLRELTTPVVFVRATDFEGHSGVMVANREAIHHVVDHVVGLGHTRVAHLAGPLQWREAQERADAWRERLVHHGLDAPRAMLAEGDWSSASGASAMAALLDRAPDLDAVVVANDRMAFGAMYVLAQRGRRVPGDVVVTGFDDVHEAAWAVPSLTSVSQPLNEMGRRAVRTLLAHQSDPDRGVTRERLDCTLVVRESSAGPDHASWPLPTP